MPKRQTPADRVLQARLAAHVLHSKVDSREHTKPARAAFDQRFYDEVEPDRSLSEDERCRRADHAKKAYFIELAIKSVQARKARRR